jgi:NarL family two-component system response regulator LiaR
MLELTERQREIATLVSEGLTEQEIADRLFLSRLTVRNHKQTIYRKLGVNNAVGMTRALIATDEVSQAPDKIPA